MIPLALLAAGAVLAVQPPAGAPRAALPAACIPDGELTRLQTAPKVQKLDELPMARLMLPVMRRIDGCNLPTFVSGPVEGNGRFAPPSDRRAP